MRKRAGHNQQRALRLPYQEPKPLSQLYSGWQEMLEEHRQIVVQVQEIAEETGWRGPEEQVNLWWEKRG